jgi:hypothetical protein
MNNFEALDYDVIENKRDSAAPLSRALGLGTLSRFFPQHARHNAQRGGRRCSLP